MKPAFCLIAALALLAGCASAPAPVRTVAQPGAQVARSFVGVSMKTNELAYLLYVPKDYATETAKKFPLVLFLHGAGERGNELQKVASTARSAPHPSRTGASAAPASTIPTAIRP